MSEKHKLSGFESIETTEAVCKSVTSKCIETKNLTAEIINIKSKLKLIGDRFKVLKGDQEIISIEDDKINVHNQLFVQNELVSYPIGMILAYTGNNIPDRWLECNGSCFNKLTYETLYNLIGKNVPDLNNSFIMGANVNTKVQNWESMAEGKSEIQISWSNVKKIELKLKEESFTPRRITAGTSSGSYEYYLFDSQPDYESKSLIIGKSFPDKINIIPSHYKFRYIIKAL